MSTPSGQPGQMGGFTNGGYGGLKKPTSANPNGYGGPDMRYGDVNPSVNMGYAAQNLPGTPYAYQQQAAGLYGTPFQSDPNQYGRWNWATGMQAPGGYQPGPGSPPIPPGTPPPGNPGSPPIPSGNTGTPAAPGTPTTGGGFGGTPTDVNPYAGGNGQTQYSPQAIAAGMTQGDIYSNPAFANWAAQQNGGTIGGSRYAPPKLAMDPGPARGKLRGLLGG